MSHPLHHLRTLFSKFIYRPANCSRENVYLGLLCQVRQFKEAFIAKLPSLVPKLVTYISTKGGKSGNIKARSSHSQLSGGEQDERIPGPQSPSSQGHGQQEVSGYVQDDGSLNMV